LAVAERAVFLEIRSTRAISEIDICSDRRRQRISARAGQPVPQRPPPRPPWLGPRRQNVTVQTA
jgi:hypothetical protein